MNGMEEVMVIILGDERSSPRNTHIHTPLKSDNATCSELVVHHYGLPVRVGVFDKNLRFGGG